MKHTFVIDENVAIAAATLTNPNTGQRELVAARLLNVMVDKCHRMAWSSLIHARWSRQSQALVARRQSVSPSFLSLLAQAQRVEGKCPLPDHGDPPTLDDETSWTTKMDDDRDFIRLAAHFRGCYLVTYDEPLMRDIREYQLDVRYGFRVLAPEDALVLASEPSI